MTRAKAALRFSLRRTSAIRVEISDDGVLWCFPAMGSSTDAGLSDCGSGSAAFAALCLSDALPSLFTAVSSSFKVQAFGAGRTYYALC